MKKALTVSLYGALVFGLLTALSPIFITATDGVKVYGLPSTFYYHYGGAGDRSSLELDGLLLDLVVAFVIGWLIAKIIRKRFSRR